MITPPNDFWKVFKETNGALSCAEALAIMNIAAQAPEGLCIELGTFEGKSAMSANYSLHNHTFVLVEPEFNKTITPEMVVAKIKLATDIKKDVLFKQIYSTDFLPTIDILLSYIFVDSGSHQDGLPMQEVKLLEDRMVQSGIIAFHDFRSQFIEVEQAYNYLLSTGKYEEIQINWDEIISYVNENNLEEGNLSWHHTELKNPCFVGALKRI